MALFQFGKKKKENSCGCCSCGCQNPQTKPAAQSKDFSIKVLGSGCKNCHTLLVNTQTAVNNLGLSVEVEYITDMEKIMLYGVMHMPALVVNGQVVSMGRVLKSADVEQILHQLGL